MGYTEPPHKDRKGKLKSYWNSDELLFLSYWGYHIFAIHVTIIHISVCILGQQTPCLGPWDPGVEDLDYMVYQLKYDSVHKTFGGDHDGKWWKDLDFPWISLGKWDGNGGKTFGGCEYVPYKGIPKFINLCWGWFMIGFTTWFRHRWCWNPFPTATRGRRFFHLGMGLLILSTFLQSLPQKCFCIGTYIYTHTYITLHYITLHTYIPHKYIYIDVQYGWCQTHVSPFSPKSILPPCALNGTIAAKKDGGKEFLAPLMKMVILMGHSGDILWDIYLYIYMYV